eukprot:7832421-Pyramimonas_sp.AAC.1
MTPLPSTLTPLPSTPTPLPSMLTPLPSRLPLAQVWERHQAARPRGDTANGLAGSTNGEAEDRWAAQIRVTMQVCVVDVLATTQDVTTQCEAVAAARGAHRAQWEGTVRPRWEAELAAAERQLAEELAEPPPPGPAEAALLVTRGR